MSNFIRLITPHFLQGCVTKSEQERQYVLLPNFSQAVLAIFTFEAVYSQHLHG
jgi:hypothetical protein